MGPFEETPLWETLHRPDFGIDTLNLVIHLSKVQQLAIFQLLTLSIDVLNNVPQYGASIFSRRMQPTAVNTSFSPLLKRQTASHMTRYQDMLSGVVLLSFGYFGEVKTVVHLIREDSHSRYMPTCGWTDHDPVMGTTHDSHRSELNPLSF